MRDETTIQHLRRAAAGYFIAGLGFLAFGFPFWFLNAVDNSPKGKFTPPFFFVVDDWLMAPAERWDELSSVLGLLVGGLSLWMAGEPTGLGTRRTFVFVPIAGAISYLLSIWIILPFAPLGAVLNGLGMILVGVASIKASVWTGWKRFAPLVVGLFPFLFMFPLRFLTGARPAAVIGLWGVAWLALGFAAWQRAQEVATRSSLASR